MATYAQRHQRAYLRAADLAGKPITLTIARVASEEVPNRNDKGTRWEPVLTFEGRRRDGSPVKMMLNATNDQLISTMLGEEDEHWPGKRITLQPEPDESGKSDDGLCIRVIGSPDIPKPVTATVRLPQRNPTKRRLIPTAAATKPPVDEDTGEILGEDADE